MIPPFLIKYNLWINLIYVLVVAVFCFVIYFKTRGLYKLSYHKGIKYFRNTFLFFGIMYVLRLFLYSFRREMVIPHFFNIDLFKVMLFIMVYASLMASIYLIYSIFWKKIGKTIFSKIYLVHILALIIALMAVKEKTPLIFIIPQIILFLLLVVVSLLHYKKTKYKESYSKLYLVYILIFLLWVITNISEFLVLFFQEFILVVHTILVVLLLFIFFKVIKETKAEK